MEDVLVRRRRGGEVTSYRAKEFESIRNIEAEYNMQLAIVDTSIQTMLTVYPVKEPTRGYYIPISRDKIGHIPKFC